MIRVSTVLVFLLFSLFQGPLAYGQKSYLSIQKSEDGRVIKVLEKSRVKLKVTDGPGEDGRIVIVDENFFKINHRQFSVDKIESIKMDRLIPGILGGGLIGFGSFIWPLDIFFTLFTGALFLGYTPIAVSSILIGVGLRYMGRKYKTEHGCEFKIIHL